MISRLFPFECGGARDGGLTLSLTSQRHFILNEVPLTKLAPSSLTSNKVACNRPAKYRVMFFCSKNSFQWTARSFLDLHSIIHRFHKIQRRRDNDDRDD